MNKCAWEEKEQNEYHNSKLFNTPSNKHKVSLFQEHSKGKGSRGVDSVFDYIRKVSIASQGVAKKVV